MIVQMSPALRALLARVIDYAGMFPPATLSAADAVANYQRYASGSHRWMLRWLVVGASDLQRVPRELDGSLSVLSDADESRAAAIEAKLVVSVRRPAYCEVAIGELDAVRHAGNFAKIRTGGIKPDAIPSVGDVAAFIR